MSPEREASFRKCHAAGLTMHETASVLKQSYQTTACFARKLRLRFAKESRVLSGRSNRAGTRAEKASKWRDLYLAGQTLQQIGTANDVTREYVRQILTNHYGSLSSLGGYSVTVRDKEAKRIAARERRYLKNKGCSWEQYCELKKISKQMRKDGHSYGTSLLGAYKIQKANTIKRGLVWNFNLWTWWQFWQQSGKWDERGRAAEAYVMCRFFDTGPYEPGNCYIDTLRENCKHISINRSLRSSSIEASIA